MLLLMVIVAHFQEVSSRRRDQRTRMYVGRSVLFAENCYCLYCIRYVLPWMHTKQIVERKTER